MAGPDCRSTTPKASSTCCCSCPWGIAAGYAWRRFWPVFAVGAAASLLIELVQGLLGNGTCHSDDLVRNAAGAAIGAGIGIVAAQVYGRR